MEPIKIQGKYSKEGRIIIEVSLLEYHEIKTALDKRLASRSYMRKYKANERESQKEKINSRKVDVILSDNILPYENYVQPQQPKHKMLPLGPLSPGGTLVIKKDKLSIDRNSDSSDS